VCTQSPQEKLAAAVKAAERFNAATAETDERKRKYNAAEPSGDAQPTPEVRITLSEIKKL